MSVPVFLVVILCIVLIARLKMKSPPRSPPTLPGALPFIGHCHQLIGDRKHLWDIVRRTQMSSVEKGGVGEFRLGSHSLYMITDPKECLTLSNIYLSKMYVYDFAKDFMKNGLVTSEVSVWKIHRKLLNPAFSQQVINTYLNEINVQARSLVSQLAPKAGTDPFDVQKYLINFTLATVTRTLLGLNDEDQTAIDTDYAQGIGDLLILYSDRIQKVWLHLSCLYKWSALKSKENQLIDKLRNILNPIIQQRKSEFKANKHLSFYNDSRLGKFKPLLDQMLQMADEQDAFTDDDIRNHLDTFVTAAYDTTTSAMTFALLAIGENQNIQERIFNEIQEVHEHKDEDFTKQDLQKLVYLEAVIKETLRLYPPVISISRKIETDIELKNHTLRAGSSCVLGLYGLLRHPVWGPDAEQFRPERWLDPANLPDHPSLNAAFGVGKRNCIGQLYSIMVMKTALAHVLRRYHVTGNLSNIVCEFDIIVKPVEGHLIELTLRT